MQDFFQGNFEETNEALERFEIMNSGNRELYFDVNQIENLFDHYLEINELGQASRILQLGLKQHPNAVSLHIKRSVLLSEEGHYDEALRVLYQYEEVEKDNCEISMSIGWLNLKKGRIDLALDFFDKTILNCGDERESFLLDIGFNLNLEGFYQESASYLAQGYLEFPDNENMLFELAYALDKNEQIEEGIEAYCRLLELNPFYENAWYNLGILYNKKNEFDKAIEAYEYSLALNPDHSESYFNIGNSYAHLGDFTKALEYYHMHASYGADKLITFQYIGECWEQMNNYPMALRFYHLVAELNPDASDAWYGIGTVLLAMGQPDKSIDPFLNALQINPFNPDYWFGHARASYETQQIAGAINSLKRGISCDPEETTAWIELLQIYQKHFPSFDFIGFIDESLTEYPNIGAVAYMAAMVYYKYASDKELALAYMKIARKRQPDDFNLVLSEFPELDESAGFKSYFSKKAKNPKKP